MTNTILKLFLSLLLTPTTALADRPSISELNTRVDQLEAENSAQQSEIDVFEARLTEVEVCSGSASAPTRFVDNGDGTICDNLTGLMWEKKDASDNVQNLSNPHDVDNRYSWSLLSLGTTPNGTIFSDFLPRLNNDATADPSMVGFAGYTDWRLPNVVELQTLLLEPAPCSIIPCIIDPIFDPTAGVASFSSYWTSTSHSSIPGLAYGVNFINALVGTSDKGLTKHVRAVRGGR